MFSFLDYLYIISLSIVGKSKILGQNYAERRAHRAVIIASYMLGLLLTSFAIYVLSRVLGPTNVKGTLFALVFTIALLTPYCIMNFIYIYKSRAYNIKDNDVSNYNRKAVLIIAYLSSHIVFLVIVYLAGHT